IHPSLYEKLPYDPVKDLAPISLVVFTPSVLVVHSDVPAKTVHELVALARAAGQAHLWACRRRHTVAPFRRAVQIGCRCEHSTGALSWHSVIAARPACGPCHHDASQHVGGVAAGARGQAARAHGDGAGASSSATRRADTRGSRVHRL